MRSGRGSPSFGSRPDLLFTFRLAERLGRTVAELEESMSNAEFMRWVALAGFDHLQQQREQMKSQKPGRGRGRATS